MRDRFTRAVTRLRTACRERRLQRERDRQLADDLRDFAEAARAKPLRRAGLATLAGEVAADVRRIAADLSSQF